MEPAANVYITEDKIDCFSPVVGYEQDVGCTDGNLEPAPISDEVGEQREDEYTDTEEHLEQDAHSASVLHSNDLCD